MSRQVITTVCPKRGTLLLAHHLDPLLRSGPPSLAGATGFRERAIQRSDIGQLGLFLIFCSRKNQSSGN
jgi:hypothetical protein